MAVFAAMIVALHPALKEILGHPPSPKSIHVWQNKGPLPKHLVILEEKQSAPPGGV
jgi:hypothetical protein